MDPHRPNLRLPLSPTEKLFEALAAAGMIACLALPIHVWSDLPAKVPTHIDPTGHPDAWGPKATVLILPAIILCVYSLLTVLPRLPRLYNYPWRITPENAERQFRIARSLVACLKMELVWLFTALEWGVLQLAFDPTPTPILGPLFLLVALTILFGTIAYYLVRSHQAR